MAFINRFAIDNRFDRFALVIGVGLVVMTSEFGTVAILAHIEIKPIFGLKPFGRTPAPIRMQRNKMMPVIAFAQTPRPRSDDRLLSIVLYIAIPAQNPNDRLVFVAPPQPFPVPFGVCLGEQGFPVFEIVMPIASPGGQKSNEQPARRGL